MNVRTTIKNMFNGITSRRMITLELVLLHDD